MIAQNKNDLSLKYGYANAFKTNSIVDIAIKENPNSKVFIKVHPDVICGKKKSDICLQSLPKKCIVIDQNINPISHEMKKLLNNKDQIEQILKKGSLKAKEISNPVISDIKKIVGFIH